MTTAHDLPNAGEGPVAQSSPLDARRACNVILACFVFVLVYFVGIYPGAADANQRSHYQLLRALAERGSAEISPELRDLGSHTDVAVRGERRYSDKAPGLSVAAVPGYRLMRLFLPMPTSLLQWLVFYGARVFSVTLVSALAMGVFARYALRRGIVPSSLPIWFFGLLFATPFQVYCRSFFAHAFAGALLFVSFRLVSDAASDLAAAFGGGLAAGAAVASEYPLSVVAVCLLAFVATQREPRRLGAFALGGLLVALALAAYHSRNFGGVFAFPSAANASYPALAHRGVAGISWPSLTGVLGLFLDPAHGLLYFSPFLILWPIVGIRSLRHIRADASLVVTAVAPLLLVLVISGFLPPHWRGGWCLGPRYLVAALPLVFWLLLERGPSLRSPASRALLLASIAYGAVILAVAGSTYWLIPYESWNPARTVSLHFLRRGLVEYNLGVAAGLPPLFSLVPPLLAVAVAFGAALRGMRISARSAAPATAAGILAAILVLAIPPSPRAVEHSHRDGLASALLPTMRAGWR